jgi:hypothetical protein
MIPVIWYDQCRGNWDHGTLLSIFEKHPDVFKQYNTVQRLTSFTSKAIIIIAGTPDVGELRNYLENGFGPSGGIVILTSEEDAYFDWKAAIPSNFEIWTQYYSPSTKSEIKTRLLLGAPLRMRDYKINKHLPKKYLWSFVGQVQNPFRQACVEVLKTLPDGFLHIAELFGGEGSTGMEYQQYLDIMCQSKYVICPAGSMCVDSFRLYEAMECGAVPITDIRAPRDYEAFNYWDSVHSAHNLLTVVQWDDLNFLLKHGGSNPIANVPVLIRNEWWGNYKQQLETRLLHAANEN